MHIEPDPIPIIDAHHHLWDLNGPLYHTQMVEHPESFLGDYAAIRRTYLPPEYRRDTALHNVVATVHVEAEVDRAQQLDETRWLEEMNRDHAMPNAIVAHSWVDTPGAEDIVAKQAASPLVRGIRTKPLTSKGPGHSVRAMKRSIQDPRWRKGLLLLRKYNLSWDLRVPFWHLSEVAELLHELPPFPVVLNHTGYPWDRSEAALAIWGAGMKALAAHEHVCCKISALMVPRQAWTLESNRPIIDETIDIFGAHRCMFASNYPVDSLLGSWDYIYSNFKRAVAHRPRAEQLSLFAGTARRFYRIDVDLPSY